MAREWQPEVPDKIIERFDPEPEEETLDQALARHEGENAPRKVSVKMFEGGPPQIAETYETYPKSAPAQTVRMKGKRKSQITLRIEPDLLDWFKALGPGYQARMHQALENYRVEVGE